MKRFFYIVCGLLLVVLLGLFFLSRKDTGKDGDAQTTEMIRGELVSSDASAQLFVLRRDIDQSLMEVHVSEDVRLEDSEGRAVAMAYFLPGMQLEVSGRVAGARIEAERLKEMVHGASLYYLNPDFRVAFSYPATWGPNMRRAGMNGIPTHFEGRDGFFTLDAVQVDEGTLESAVGSIAYHKLKPYGDAPEILHQTIDGQEAAIIVPREDALKDAALVVRYPREVRINDAPYSFFVVYVDKEHVQDIARTVRFFENSLNEKAVSGAPNILVYQPRQGDIIRDSFTVAGFARVSENKFMIRLSADGVGTLMEEVVSTRAADAGVYGYFEHDMVVSSVNLAKLKNHPQATLQVFVYSARDGFETDTVTVPIVWQSDSIETARVSVFFPNSKMDSSGSCTHVYPVPREILRTKAVAASVLEELLQGPTSGEREQGYFTSLNAGVRVQRLAIQNGIATVDFDAALDRAVAGSCRVTSIRAQITETLKQFPTVQSVIISIGGRTEDILQP